MFSLPRSRSGPAPLCLNHDNVVQVKGLNNHKFPSNFLSVLPANSFCKRMILQVDTRRAPLSCLDPSASTHGSCAICWSMLRKLGQYSLQNDSSWGKDWEWIMSLCSLPAIPDFRKAYHTFYRNSSWQMRAFIVFDLCVLPLLQS